ncbi:glycosyltransferase family 87 protein [Pseudonocardia phyllosphaerae]|uniref:glycosyltransferase family 87 protein n=1 Tax=Pseudonocardia phyllosphaerae TaxID=3390502 RepID=UPI0039784576
MTVTRPTTDPGPRAVADGHVLRVRSALTARRTLWVTVPLLLISGFWSFYRMHGYALDLDVYRIGVQVWLAGGDMYGPLPTPQYGPPGMPFIYPVFAAITMIPLATVPYGIAFGLQFAATVLSLAVCIALSVRVAWPAGGWRGAGIVLVPALAATLLIEPAAQTMAFGQINMVLMALVLVDLLAPRTYWPRGMLLGIAAAIKLTPGGFVLFFLLRRDRRSAAVSVVTGAVATGIGFLVDFDSSYRYWFVGGPAAGVSGSTFFSNETVKASLARMDIPEPWLSVTWLVLVAILLALAVPVIRRSEPVLAMSATAAVILAATPTAWSHHWVWIIPALCGIGVHAARYRSWQWLTVGAVLGFIFFLAPFRWMPNQWGVVMAWTPGEQLLAASYVLPCSLTLALGCWFVTRGPGRPGGPEAAPPEALRVPSGETARPSA